MTDCSAPYTYDSTSLENPQRRDDHLRPQTLCPIQMDTTTLDDTPNRTRGTSITFLRCPQQIFKTRKGKTNLLPHQHRALRMLQQQQIFLIVPCDKNLGPAIIERHDYLKIAMRDHLSNTTTYKSLSTIEINRYSSEIKKHILEWLKTYNKKLTKMERAVIRAELKSSQSPFARFYLTLKAHKLKPGQTVDQLKSRPIVSCPGSLLHRLGVWVERKLQEVAKNTISYFKNTLELKKQLLELHLPTNARLLTADAVSMYTNIPTHTALNLIGKYLAQYQRKNNNEYQ